MWVTRPRLTLPRHPRSLLGFLSVVISFIVLTLPHLPAPASERAMRPIRYASCAILVVLGNEMIAEDAPRPGVPKVLFVASHYEPLLFSPLDRHAWEPSVIIGVSRELNAPDFHPSPFPVRVTPAANPRTIRGRGNPRPAISRSCQGRFGRWISCHVRCRSGLPALGCSPQK